MAEVPVDFEVEIEKENGDGRDCNGADGLKKSGGSNGISQDGRSLSSSGNKLCFQRLKILVRDCFCWEVQAVEALGTNTTAF